MSVRFDPDAPPAPTRDAATIVLVRDNAHGRLEVLFLRRNADVRFMGGAYVFPGGKLDPADFDDTLACNLSPEQAAHIWNDNTPSRARAHYIAAMRECIEESGVVIATSSVSNETARTLRETLKSQTLRDALLAHNLELDAQALRPFSRWVTPPQESRRFDARFFVAVAPANADASHDQNETVASAWIEPAVALEKAERGEIVLAPPTWCTTAALAGFATAHEAFRMSPDQITESAMPRVQWLDSGGFVVCVPGDPAHEEAPPAWLSALSTRAGKHWCTRFSYADGGWRRASLSP